MTIRSIIEKSGEYLADRGVESPRLQIELMLSKLLNLPRLNLYLDLDATLHTEKVGIIRGWVRRRGQREPLQHILGSTSFCSCEIGVTSSVLVPRPETELLVENAIKLLAPLSSKPVTVLDLGTGSGCIAIALAKEVHNVAIHAVDISAAAIETARANATANAVANRIHFYEGDGFHALPGGLKFDLILSNPPYIPTAEIESLQPEVKDFDPRSALDGGLDGLDFYRMLATQSAGWMHPGAKVLVEFGDGQAEDIRTIFQSHNHVVEAILPDYSRRARNLISRLADATITA